MLEPARKLLLSGDEETLTNADLLSLVLGSYKAAEAVCAQFGSLGSVEEATPTDLLDVPEVGRSRAAALRAALILGRRREGEKPWRGASIRSSCDVYSLLSPMVRHEKREVLLALALDVRNRPIRSPIVVAIGSLTKAVVEPRELLRPLIVAAAAHVILAHNHPSGCPEPSGEDVALSKVLSRATALLGIQLLDHVVLGDGGYVSLADRGLI